MYGQGCILGIFVCFFFFSAFTSAVFYLPPSQQIGQFQVNMAAEQRHKDNYVPATVEISG